MIITLLSDYPLLQYLLSFLHLPQQQFPLPFLQEQPLLLSSFDYNSELLVPPSRHRVYLHGTIPEYVDEDIKWNSYIMIIPKHIHSTTKKR